MYNKTRNSASDRNGFGNNNKKIHEENERFSEREKEKERKQIKE